MAVLATHISRIVFVLQRARLNIARLFMYFMGVGLIQYVFHPLESLPVRLISGSRKSIVPLVRSGRDVSQSSMV